MLCVDLHGLLGNHVVRHGRVSRITSEIPQGLGLHDSLHIGGPSVLACHQGAGGFVQPLADLYLFDLVSQHFLAQFAEAFE